MSEMGDVKLILLKGEVEAIRRLFYNTINELQRHLKSAEERAEVFEGHDDSQYEYFLGEATAYKKALELLGWCGTDKTDKGGWREQPITEKQKEYINDMQEFSYYPLPKFTGTTKGEASDYIEKYRELAHENVNSPTFGY